MERKAGKYVGNNIIFTKMMCPFHKNKAKKWIICFFIKIS